MNENKEWSFDSIPLAKRKKESMQIVKPVSSDIEKVLIGGDLSKLSPEQRVSYYNKTCETLGLNPLTRPFDYIRLNGKEILYARKDATEQLRKLHGVSIRITKAEASGGVFVVIAEASDKNGRVDSSTGAVPVEGLKGDNLANALMKAETKAKRRVTLSICGLGILDETELESIPELKNREKVVQAPTQEVLPAPFINDAQESGPGEIPVDLEDEIVRVGKKYVGKPYRSIQTIELGSFLSWVTEQRRIGKCCSPDWDDFVAISTEILAKRNDLGTIPF